MLVFLIVAAILLGIAGGICLAVHTAAIVTWVLFTLAALCLVGFFGGVIRNWFRYTTSRFDMLIRIVLGILAVAALVFSGWKLTGEIQNWNLSRTQVQQPADGDGETGEPEQGTLDHLKLDVDQKDMQLWLDQFDPNWRTTIRPVWDYNSMPSQAAARREAVAAVGGQFEFPVSIPFEDFEALKSGKATPEQLQAALHAIQVKIMTDPIYQDQMYQGYIMFPEEAISLNQWLPIWKDDLDGIFANEDTLYRGINGMLNNDATAQTDEVFYNGVRAAMMLDFMKVTGVEAAESAHNWMLPITTNASDTRTVESSVQESSSALILVARYKLSDGTEGEVAIKIGFNLYDQRLELFDPKVPVKSEPADSEPEPEDTNPPGTGNPTTYSILVECYDYATNGLLKSYTAFSDLTNGTKKTVTAPDIANYKVRDGGSQSVTINGSNATVKFYYDKISVSKYDITVNCYDYANNELLRTYAAFTGLTNGTKKTITAPDIANYTVRAPKSVDVTINGNHAVVNFYYDKVVAEHTLYYQRGYYNYNGTWILIDQSPVKVGVYKTGADYSFSVNAPTGNQDTRYSLRDGSTYSGKMPDKDHTVTVVVIVEHRLNISYKKVTDQGSVKAFEPYDNWYAEGAHYNVGAPYLEGYTAYPDPVAGRMEGDAVWMTVFYYKNGQTPDGNGAKVPQTDPANTERDDGSGKSNAETGGGHNRPTDGTGTYEPNETPAQDYPAQGSTSNKPGTTTGGGSSTQQTTQTVTEGDKQTSGETGGKQQNPVIVPDDPNSTLHDGGYETGNITDGATAGQATTTQPNGNGGTTTVTEDIHNTDFDGKYGGGEPG